MGFLTGTLFAWLGHACFIITTVAGAAILIDPVSPAVGFPVKAHSVDANVIFVSADNPQHNWTDMAISAQNVVPPKTDPGYQDVKFSYVVNDQTQTIHAKRIFAYRDDRPGKSSATTTITVLDVDGLRICHLGDLGQRQLTPKQLSLIGKVDVLMTPVGDGDASDGKDAAAITRQLHPRIIFPMEYRTANYPPDVASRMHPLSEYLNAMEGKALVLTGDADRYPVSADRLPENPIIVVLKSTSKRTLP